MALEEIKEVRGRGVYVAGDDIDTDRIIPARFMKCITFDGLGEFLFYDVRKEEDGSEKKHPLNDPRFSEATILLSGSNFGCGSSREHAPQAIYRYGFRAIIAESFAEIFFGNSTTLGMPCMSLPREDIREIAAAIDADPTLEIVIDVENQKIQVGEKTYQATLRESARQVLVAGRWDPITDLLESQSEVAAVAERLPYI
ncbi:MAG TPA: 3-isopropylmalate dehydratase small subunit [Opitutales bacterium]|nr:3-isopropylmalate dehydratase small subunit [Opitutales bacterium]